jgi:hypothetical protein
MGRNLSHPVASVDATPCSAGAGDAYYGGEPADSGGGMWNPFEYIRRRMARARYIPRQPRHSGTTAIIAMAVVALIIVLAIVLEMRNGGEDEATLEAYVAANRTDALELVTGAARAHRYLMLGDVPGATAPKRFAGQAIEKIAREVGIDAIGLDIDADLQPWIDSYLTTRPEDASGLLSHPRALRDAEDTGPAWLDLYRTIWRLNDELGADRRIRVIALDLPGWPPVRALGPSQAATAFAARDSAMLRRLTDRLERSPRSKVVIFADGLHVLQGHGEVQTGGTSPIRFAFLGGELRQRFPGDVYSVLLDAPAGRGVSAEVAKFRRTRAFEVLRGVRAGSDGPVAVRLTPAFDFNPRMIETVGTPGLDFRIVPPDYALADLVNAYIYLGS